MTNQMQAVLMIAEYSSIKSIMIRNINVSREEILLDNIEYGVLSGGQKTAVSWIWVLWTDGPVPKGWRDPFEGFGVIDRNLQRVILGALAFRHGLIREG